MTPQKLVTPEAVKHINSNFISLRNKLSKIAFQDHDSIKFAHTLTFATDEWLLDLWEEAIDPHLLDHCALFALGGYGRRELCFFSDLDLVIEVPNDAIIDDPALSLGVERFMAWTREARVKLSHAVRTTQQARQAFQDDPRTAVSLIDARPLDLERTYDWQCVDSPMAVDFLRGHDYGETFLHDLTAAHHERRKRHGKTVYLLEPDLKNGDGGLRDLNNIHWAARVRYQFDVLTELRPELDWNEEHQNIYIRGLRWLLGLRTLLHITHNRKHDRLNFTDQEALALHLSQLYPENYPQAPIAATETLMRNHYRYARAVSRTSQQFLRHWNIPDNTTSQLLGTCFESVNKQLALRPIFPDQHITDDSFTHEYPILEDSQILEALAVASRENIPLDPALELYIDAHVQDWSDAQRHNPLLNTQFIELLTDPNISENTSQYLLELGILTKLVPEFDPIVCHVQHDVYHVYTTDVHSLKCLEMARSLINSAQQKTPPPHKWPAFEEIAERIQDIPIFLLAALFHDIGKNRGGRHSQKGAALVANIAQRFGLQRRRADQLAFLVREHLTLSLTARRRDISDRRVIRDIAQRLRTVETLNLLTALTLCDMSTVGPDLMSDWNATLIIDLYRRLKDALEHGVESMWIDDQLDQVDDLRDDLLLAWKDALANNKLPPQQQEDTKIAARIDEFIRDAPGDHLLASSPDQLLRQFIAYDHGCAVQGTAVLTTPLPEDGVTEIILSTQDVPGTLAKIAGTISSAGLNIVTANIVTTSSGRTLDIFLVHLAHSIASPHRTEPTALTKPDRIERLEENLRLVLDGQLDVEELLEKKIRENRLPPRPTPTVDTSVTIHQNLSDAFTVLEVQAPDQIGLLYTITHTLWQNDINTHVSKIDSVGNQVVDTFYIEDIKGGKLSSEKAAIITTALHQILHT